MAETVGELLVKIGADVSDLRRGTQEGAGVVKKFASDVQFTDREMARLRQTARELARGLALTDASAGRAKTGVQGLAGSFTALKAGIAGLGLGIVVGGLSRLVQGALQTAGRLSDVAAQTGISAEALQELRYASEQAGASIEQLEASLNIFARNLGQARENTGPLVQALRGTNDELLRTIRSAGSVEEALDAAFRGLAGIEDAAKRAAVAQAIFGRSGAALIPMIENGAAGLDAMRKRARDLGLVMSNELVAKGDAAGDRLAELGSVIKSNLNQALVQLAPAIEKAAGAFVDATPKIRAFFEAFLPGEDPIRAAVRRIDPKEIAQRIADVMGQLEAARKQLEQRPNDESLARAIEALEAKLESLRAAFTKAAKGPKELEKSVSDASAASLRSLEQFVSFAKRESDAVRAKLEQGIVGGFQAVEQEIGRVIAKGQEFAVMGSRMFAIDEEFIRENAEAILEHFDELKLTLEQKEIILRLLMPTDAARAEFLRLKREVEAEPVRAKVELEPTTPREGVLAEKIRQLTEKIERFSKASVAVPVDLLLQREQYEAELRKLQAMRVSVDVDLQAKFREAQIEAEIARLRQMLDNFAKGESSLTADMAVNVQARMEQLQEKLAAERAKQEADAITVPVDADTSEAERKVEELRQKAERIGPVGGVRVLGEPASPAEVLAAARRLQVEADAARASGDEFSIRRAAIDAREFLDRFEDGLRLLAAPRGGAPAGEGGRQNLEALAILRQIASGIQGLAVNPVTSRRPPGDAFTAETERRGARISGFSGELEPVVQETRETNRILREVADYTRAGAEASGRTAAEISGDAYTTRMITKINRGVRSRTGDRNFEIGR